jgi:hypothetical protein
MTRAAQRVVSDCEKMHGAWAMVNGVLHAGWVKTMKGTQNKERKAFTVLHAVEILHMHKS